MDERYKMVEYHKYCDSCKHKDVDDHEEPCNVCLGTPLNWCSEKPINYEAKTK